MAIVNGSLNGKGNGNGVGWLQRLFGRSQWSSHDLAAYRRLALQLHLDLPRENGARTVLVMTPARCRFSAAGSLQLASSLEQELRRPVLLVDACASQPEISTMLGCENFPGWSDLLNDADRSLENVVLATSSEHLRFVPAGKRLDLSQASGMNAKTIAAREQYDFVLVFGGSVLDDPEALAFLPHVKCVLLFVTENETRLEELQTAQEALALRHAPDVRLVLTTPLRGKKNLRGEAAGQQAPQLRTLPKLVVE